MKIHIETLEVSCIIGVLDFEREVEQKVRIDIEIDYTYHEGAYLDYSKVAALTAAQLKREKYLLLEEALIGIKTLLFAHFPAIEQLELKLSKPDILPSCSVGLSDRWVNRPQ